MQSALKDRQPPDSSASPRPACKVPSAPWPTTSLSAQLQWLKSKKADSSSYKMELDGGFLCCDTLDCLLTGMNLSLQMVLQSNFLKWILKTHRDESLRHFRMTILLERRGSWRKWIASAPKGADKCKQQCLRSHVLIESQPGVAENLANPSLKSPSLKRGSQYLSHHFQTHLHLKRPGWC